MNGFEWAIKELKHGAMVSREGWNGKGMWLIVHTAFREMQVPFGMKNGEVVSHSLEPFIAMKTADNKMIPWLASQTDLLACDWGYSKW